MGEDVEGVMVTGSEEEVIGFAEEGVGTVMLTGRVGQVRGLAVGGDEEEALEIVEHEIH